MANRSESGGGRRRLFSMRRRARGGQGDGSGMSDKRQQIRAGKRAANNRGCASKSKLFMLVLPLIAVGAYLLHLA